MNEIIAKTIAEAKECLIDADSLIKMERWKASVSRSYYSMYHSAKAALSGQGI